MSRKTQAALAPVTKLPGPGELSPAGSIGRPFDRLEALADLRQLGQHLDDQAKRGESEAELDATLAVMRSVHERISSELTRSLRAVTVRRTARHNVMRSAA